ncbi:putative vacuolar membrane transporter for cationic amino acids [Coemansia sp. RSA 2559]|nr:putative vacuolar membrane transporter for cationic amino acids [Coemansia sp. RSA 2559]
MWLAGDFADWYGAYIGRLLLPAILIALYFVITDIVLLAQMFCYRKSDEDIFGVGQLPEGAERPPLLVRRGRRACRFSGPENAQKRMEEYREAEREALLERGFMTDDTTGDANRTLNITTYGAIASTSSNDQVGTQEPRIRRKMLVQALASLRRLGSARAGRAITISVLIFLIVMGIGVGSRIVLSLYPQSITDILSQVFGYISAAMFFVAYIPQIAWNFTAQSTEGLSASMFVFTVLGNVTYCLSILSISTDRDFLVAYAPWLAGAAGTLGFETLVLWQCFIYSRNPDDDDDDNNDSNDGGRQASSELASTSDEQRGSSTCSSEVDNGGCEADRTSMLSRSRRRRQRRRYFRRHSNSINIAGGSSRNSKEAAKSEVAMSLQI